MSNDSSHSMPKTSMTPSASQAIQPRCPVCLAPDTTEVRPYRTGPTPSLGPFEDLFIRSCEHCRAAFAWPTPQEQALEAFYTEAYRSERGQDHLPPPNGWNGGAVRARAQVEFVMQEFSSPRSWLDIGAGHGYLLNEARRRHVTRTGAIEPDTRCRGRLQADGHYLYAGLSKATFGWDVVSCSHVLEHLTNPRRFLDDIQGLLSDGGHVFCEVPNETHLSRSLQDLPHLLFFTQPTLERLFGESGMTIISVSSCGRTEDEPRWREFVRGGARRLLPRLLTRPPRWIDHLVHPHFQYHQDPSTGAWIRLLARKA
jgi:SAM-dependent methyltransferase